MTPASERERALFEHSLRALEAEIANVGAHLGLDASARQAYARQIRLLADELGEAARAGRISWAQAAQQAQETRNLVMELVRGRSTPVGRALAEAMKREGATLNALVAKKTLALFGPGAEFATLSAAQKNTVYAEVVSAAGKSRPEVTAMMRRLSHAGRGLLFLSLALSVYTIASAEDKAQAAAKELAITGAGIGGGMAAGALAGLVCGPGAPVCVTVGAFAGGALAAFGVSLAW
jgi:hypothetical protein